MNDKEPRKLADSLLVNLGLAIVLRSLAHACLFLSLSEGARVFAVILYELYPFILLTFSSFAHKDEWSNETRQTKLRNIAIASACFFGVAVAFLGNAENVNIDSATLMNTALAALAALFAASDNIFHFRARSQVRARSRVADKTGDALEETHPVFPVLSKENIKGLRVVLLTDVITRSSMAVIFVSVILLYGSPISPVSHGMILAAALGFLVYGFGTTAWQFALQASKNSSLISLWYLTPVFSITLLSVFAGDDVTNLSALGVFIVIFGNYVLHERQINLDPIFTTGFFSIVICFMFYHTTPVVTSDRFFTLIELASAIFAILSGFLLSQQNENNRKNSEDRLYILQKLRKGARNYLKTLQLPICIAGLPIQLQLMLRVVQLDNYESDLERRALEGEIYRLNRLCPSEEVDDCPQYVENWMLSKKAGESIRTDIIIWILGVLLVWAIAVGRAPSFVGDLAGIFLTTGTIAVMLIIRDQKLNHSHTFSALAYASQQPVFDVFGAFFVPKKHLDTLGEGSLANHPCICEKDGKIVRATNTSAETGAIRWIMLGIAIVVFIMSIFGVASKHYELLLPL